MHGNRFEIGNEELSPENALETDVSLHYHGKYVSIDLAAFRNQINDYIYISPTAETTTDGTAIYRYSQTNAVLYGGEAGIRFHPASLPWLQVEGAYSSVVGKQNNGDFLPFIPAHKIRYEIRDRKRQSGVFKEPQYKNFGSDCFPAKQSISL